METSSLVQSYLKYSPLFKDAFANKWSFVSFEDAGEDWKIGRKFRCHCGKILKYRYALRYEGSMDDLSVILLNDEKDELVKKWQRDLFWRNLFWTQDLRLIS